VAIRSEQRVIRPFLGLDAYEGFLRPIHVWVNRRQLKIDKDYLDETLFADLNIQLDLKVNTGEVLVAANDTGLRPDQLSFAVIAYGNTFKRSEVLRSWNLEHDQIEETLSFHTSDLPEIFGDSFGGFNLVFAVILNSERPSIPLQVSTPGTWLTKREVQVRPERSVSFFAPTPMNLAKKKDFELSAKALLYIQEGPESIQYATTVEQALTVWVDEETLLSLSNNNNPAADVAAMLLARTAIGAVIELIGRVVNARDFDAKAFILELNEEGSDERVLTRFVRRAHKVLGNNEDWEATLDALKSDPQLVASKIEAQADLKSELRKALARGEV
jgi:hypothetical protein